MHTNREAIQTQASIHQEVCRFRPERLSNKLQLERIYMSFTRIHIVGKNRFREICRGGWNPSLVNKWTRICLVGRYWLRCTAGASSFSWTGHLARNAKDDSNTAVNNENGHSLSEIAGFGQSPPYAYQIIYVCSFDYTCKIQCILLEFQFSSVNFRWDCIEGNNLLYFMSLALFRANAPAKQNFLIGLYFFAGLSKPKEKSKSRKKGKDGKRDKKDKHEKKNSKDKKDSKDKKKLKDKKKKKKSSRRKHHKSKSGKDQKNVSNSHDSNSEDEVSLFHAHKQQKLG